MYIRSIALLCALTLLTSACSASAVADRAHSYPAQQSYSGLQSYSGAQHEPGVAGDELRTASVAESVDGASPAPPTDAQRAENNARANVQRDAAQPKRERKLVRNAWMTVEVSDEDDFAPTLKRAVKIAESLDGYVQAETQQSITMLVPTDRLAEAVVQVEKLGEVTRREISVQDVSASYLNLQIRIDNLRRMRVRLTELVQQATEVKDILEVERELSRVTLELESLEGQLRFMDKQTTYATLHLAVEESVSPGPIGWVFYGIGMGIKWLFVWD